MCARYRGNNLWLPQHKINSCWRQRHSEDQNDFSRFQIATLRLFLQQIAVFQNFINSAVNKPIASSNEQFKYLATTVKNQNCIQREINSRLKSGNACYHTVQKILSSSLLSKNVKTKIHRTVIFLLCFFFWVSNWSLKLTEERRLKVFENRVLRRICGPMKDEVTGEWRGLYNEELNDLYSLPNIIRMIKSGRMKWMGHVTCMGERRCV